MSINHDALNRIHRVAYDYWQMLAGSNARPLRIDFDPFAIASVLPNVIMTNVIDQGRDFQFRVFGQIVRDRLIGNYTGMCLSELPNQDNRQKVWRSYRDVAQNGQPLLSVLDYTGPFHNIRQADELYLPFFQTDGLVQSILVAVAFDQDGYLP
ncbi:MAG: PAS domain-containing protein [Alphaproteobacteria bacterium]